MISNLEYYRVFYCAASEGSFTRAAKKLYVTQSAVSQSIHHLEEELGHRLFNRTTKGLILTEEGIILYHVLQNAFSEIDRGEQDLKEHQKETKSLKIGTTLIALEVFLEPVLLQYRKEHPEIRLIIRESTVSDLSRMLESGEIDLAFLVTPIGYGTRLELKELTTVQDIACASSDYPMNFERIYTPQQLLEFPLISTDQETGIRTPVDEWFWNSGIIFSPGITTRSGAEAEELTRKGFGVGILPAEAIAGDLQKGILRKVRTTSLPEKRTIYLAMKPGEMVTEQCRELMEMIEIKKKEIRH